MSLSQYLKNALLKNNYTLSEIAQEKLLAYMRLLHKWNQTFNLTAVRELKDMVYLHILDSLSITPFLSGNKILDVGTGAGLPGLPLAITLPTYHFFLLDSIGKKTRFLTHVVHALEIKNVTVIQDRIEKYHPPFVCDTILARAVGSLRHLLESTAHLLNENNYLLAMKGEFSQTECEAIPPGFKITAIHPLIIHGLPAQRHLICCQKETL